NSDQAVSTATYGPLILTEAPLSATTKPLAPAAAYHDDQRQLACRTCRAVTSRGTWRDGGTMAPRRSATPAGEDARVQSMESEGSLESRAHKALVAWLTEKNPQPGRPVPIREFARRLGMSRTPVRSAGGRLYERG